jgi:hypothetical protein
MTFKEIRYVNIKGCFFKRSFFMHNVYYYVAFIKDE